jgi:WhiB family redox-sensing transcriptional regulator
MDIVLDVGGPPLTHRNWRTAAACLDEDPELFFPIGSTESVAVQDQILEAKAVCSGCLVQATCLKWALEAGVDDGVWGGLDEDELRALRRRNARRRSRPAASTAPVAPAAVEGAEVAA